MTIPAPAPPASSVRYFTVQQANRALPLVRRIVQDIVELYNDLHRRRERLVTLRVRQGQHTRRPDDPYEAEVLQMESDLEQDVERLQEYVDELRQIGAELKDPFTGLVDFRTIVEGREAYLCWRLGEDEITAWHELDAGYEGRRPLLATAGGAEDCASPTTEHHHN
jgi:hypothetical protein